MKLHATALLGLTVLLTACPQPTPPEPPPSPNPQTLYVTGKAPDAKNFQPVPLVWRENIDRQIGTMDVLHQVELNLTPELYKTGTNYTLQDWKDALGLLNCDVSKLNVENTRYTKVDLIYFKESVFHYPMWAGTSTPSGADREDRVEYTFSYVENEGRMWGSAACSNWRGNLEFDIHLQPGWNIVKGVYAWDPTRWERIGTSTQVTIPTPPRFEVDWLLLY